MRPRNGINELQITCLPRLNLLLHKPIPTRGQALPLFELLEKNMIYIVGFFGFKTKFQGFKHIY